MKKALINQAFRDLAILEIARIAWNVTQNYLHQVGIDESPASFDNLADNTKKYITDSTEKYVNDEALTAEDAHNEWLEEMHDQGWKFGDTFSLDEKSNPSIVPFSEKDQTYQVSQNLFRSVVANVSAMDLSALVAVSAAVVDKPAAEPVKAPDNKPAANLIVVRYIGRKPDWHDRLYNSGLYFVSRQARNVPVTIAKKLLRHTDLFEEVTKEKAVTELEKIIGDVVSDVSTTAPQNVGDDDGDGSQDQDSDTPDSNNESSDEQDQDDADGKVDDTQELLDNANKVQEEKDKEQNIIQEAYDMIDRMNSKEEVAAFAKAVPYQQTIKKTLTLDNMKEQAKRLVDQIGVL